MRFRVIGKSESAKAVRTSLFMGGVVVADEGYGFTIEVTDTDLNIPTVDGVDSEIERLMLDRIAEVANTPIMMMRPGGNRSDQHIVIGVPQTGRHLVERGIAQAVIRMAVPAKEVKEGYFQRIFRAIFYP